jgi:hypothetical protein
MPDTTGKISKNLAVNVYKVAKSGPVYSYKIKPLQKQSCVMNHASKMSKNETKIHHYEIFLYFTGYRYFKK